MRGIGLYTSILVGVVLVFFGVIYWPSIQKISRPTIPDSTLERYDFQLAESYLKKQRPIEALHIITQYQDSMQKQSEAGKLWLKLFVQASALSKDAAQLEAIYDFNPDALEEHEKAALLLAESFILSGKESNYEALRQKWKMREANKEAWFLLDVDYRLATGDYDGALEALKSTPLKGAFETSRLLRLGLLHAASDPDKALEYFEDAQSNDPSNIDAIVYQAKLLEDRGDLKGAEIAYKEGLQTNPSNQHLRDHLANYYIRSEKPAKALATLKEGMAFPGSQIYLTKALFLNHVVGPVDHKAFSQAISQDKSSSLNHFFLSLKSDELWNEDAYLNLKNREVAALDSEELFWLGLLNHLKSGNEDEALQLLHTYQGQKGILNPRLEYDLLQLITFKKTGDFFPGNFESKPNTSSHPLLQAIRDEKLAPSPEIRNLLQSQEAYAALFLAAGWSQAALSLSQLDVMPVNFPDWYPLELTQAIRLNQGDASAFAFATKQTLSSPLTQATQELEARIALSKGNTERAEVLYRSLESISAEAKSYLARKAFKEGDWDKAKQLTQELIALYPDNKTLKENLNKIELEQAATVNIPE